jgi:hypothetical protein
MGLGVLLLAAACGGGVSRQDFAAQADPICARVSSALQDLGQPQSPTELVSYLEKFVPLTSNGVDDLRKVKPPEKDRDVYDKWIETLAQETDKAKEALAATQAGDQKTSVAALGEVDQLNTKSNGLAADLGLHDCAQP